ncbi:MAG TPA: hypothetical protein VN700_06315 [Vicinamibacterales bacterium]|nr:hypothetical protein [Vicinamibacterales bacterium]
MRRATWIVLAVVALAITCGKSSPATPSGSGCVATQGSTCFGTQNYVEFAPGNFPVVISMPHGGAIAPATIPDRTGANITTATDANTIDLGRAIADAFQSRTGRRPHLVICHLRRTKLDANREIVEAAQGNADAVQAWTEYHGFIEQAMSTVGAHGFYIDLHGHGHTIQRLELGYLLPASTLDLADAELNAGGYASQSSLRLAMPSTSLTFAGLLRGPSSIGGLLGSATPSVPSPAAPSPGGDPFFDGGYSTDRHTARLPGLQIESNFTGVRDNASNRAAFADRLVTALVTFLDAQLGIR